MQYRGTEVDDLRGAVFSAIGEASVCWEKLDGTGVFDSDRAKEIGEELMEIVESETQQPNLGLATTRELLQELAARFDLEALRPYPAKDPHAGVALIRVSMLLQRLTPKTLDYRTVEGD